jgi:hypothetical protein
VIEYDTADWPGRDKRVTLPCPKCGKPIDYRLAVRHKPEGGKGFRLWQPTLCYHCDTALPEPAEELYEDLDEPPA